MGNVRSFGLGKLDTPGGNHDIRQEVQTILEEGVGQYNTGRLRELLGHADQRLRLKAQFELVNRGDTGSLLVDSQDNLQIRLYSWS